MRRVRRGVLSGSPNGPMLGLAWLLGLLASIAATVGLDARGWVVGITCGAGLAILVTRSMIRHGRDRLGPADRVTLARGDLACGVAALTAATFASDPTAPAATALSMAALATVALVLDGVDGRIARRTGTATQFGQRFDYEVDAFLILVLSVCVAREFGWWVLSLGLARYLFIAAGWMLPWLRTVPPPRAWAKVVAVMVAVVLIVAVAGVLSDQVTLVMLLVAVLLLAESFGRSIWALWVLHGGRSFPGFRPTSALAILLVWAVLLMPDRLDHLTPAAFARIPIEGLLFVALVLVLPASGRQILALLGGLVLGVLTILRVLDMGFQVALDDPFHPISDVAYAGAVFGLLSETFGREGAIVAVVGAALLAVLLLVLPTLAALRLSRVVILHRRGSAHVLAVVAAIGVIAAVSGTRMGPAGPFASTSTALLAHAHVTQVRDDLRDEREFSRALQQGDPLRDTLDAELAGLRGMDVLLVLVESYGSSAQQMPAVAAAIEAGEGRLARAGFTARSGWLTSPTFGGLSWLAHATLQSGLWVDSQRRFDQLVSVSRDRFTLTEAFGSAGWRTVVDAPALQDEWPEATDFYRFDQVYDRRNVGYRGPGFTWGAMPDQYTLAAFQRLELDRPDRRPVMAQINLVSSHWPWPPPPRLVAWDRVGDGSVFEAMEATSEPPAGTLGDARLARDAYAAAIAYSLASVTSFVDQLHDRPVVIVLLGDHQPSSLITGPEASRDVPVSVIASDPGVLQAAQDWGWREGLRPSEGAPVWRMDTFRDRFLTAFGRPPP